MTGRVQTPAPSHKGSDRYMEARRLFDTNALPQRQPHSQTNLTGIQRERLKRSGKCPDVREQHLYPMILVSTEGRTFLLHHPGGKSLEAALLAFVLLLTHFSPEEKGLFRLVSLGEELNMLNSAPSRASPSD